MRTTGRSTRGFTLVEMMMVIAIAATLAGLAAIGLDRVRPRADLATTSQELHSLLRGARQHALATGRATVVLFLPNQDNRRGGVGRVVVLEDPSATFMTAAGTPNLTSYVATTDTSGAAEVIGALDLPHRIVLALAPGANTTFEAPYTRVTPSACSFCAASGENRGAIRFDARGRATFHNALGAPLDLWGASLALSMRDTRTSTPVAEGVRLFIVTGSTGGVKSIVRG